MASTPMNETYHKKGKYQQYRKSEGEILLVHVARLSSEKGQKYLLDVARILKEKELPFRMLIAGQGPEEERLKAMRQEFDVEECVIFLGQIQDVDELLESADIFLFSSFWEGFGYAVVEAMFKAKPVIAFDTCSMPELIDHAKTGFLIPPFDTRAYAGKLIELAKDENLRANMGDAGKKKVIERFDKKERMEEIRSFILSKVSSRRK